MFGLVPAMIPGSPRQVRFSRSTRSAPPQVITWSNIWPSAFSWNFLGLKTL